MGRRCELVLMSCQWAVSIRARASGEELAEVLGRSLAKLSRHLGAYGEAPAGPVFAAFHRGDGLEWEIEVGMPTSRPLPDNGEVKASSLPGGPAVMCLHVGHPAGVRETYEALLAWVRDNGRQAAGIAYELFLDDPAATVPARRRIQVLLPLADV